MSNEERNTEKYKFIKTSIHAGAEQQFSLLHMTDTHIALADERDDLRKRELAERRSLRFPRAEELLQMGAKLAREKNIPIVHTGDLIDFVSYANLERANQFVDENDCFMVAGNHEFSLYVGEAVEDAAYRNLSLPRVQTAFKNDIRFASRKVNGVNLIAIDNSYYLMEPDQLAMLKKEVSLGMPVILLMHTPLYTPQLFDYIQDISQGPDAGSMCVPRERMSEYPPERLRQQLSDETTQRAYDYIVNEPHIHAVVAGHLHFDYQGFITPTLPQYITGTQTLRELCID